MRLIGKAFFALGLAAIALAGCGEPRSTAERAESAPPRGVILFLGDGMGVSTVTAARIFAGQLAGGTGEEHSLSFESFPHVALVKTYNTDAQVPDSAGTMTAIVTGEKTRAGVLSVSAAVERGDCAAGLAEPLTTLLEQAEAAGFATGIVSTATITHATPAATYAHSADRNWEDNSTLPEAAVAAGCRDIARQLVEFDGGDGIEVALGGGRGHFLPAGEPDPEYPDRTGFRTDGRNLVAEWLTGDGRAYAWNLPQLEALHAAPAQQVLGLFEPSHMQFEVDRTQNAEPSLATMTEFALKRLMDRSPGYFLMVEGARIDHGHHFGNAYRALHDTLAL
ncbi:MAG: alkaline phosphatase, partial [Gammaproteobacteria bacterium]|nr:alkaline phosphatase [Gammaproteobacteria bacterium]